MPYKRVSLLLGAPLGNLEVIRLPGLFLREKNYMSEFRSWTQRTLKF